MNPVHAVRDRLERVFASPEPRSDPFDDADIETVDRADVDETTPVEYPIPDRMSGDSVTVRVLILFASGDTLELDETLYRRDGDALEIELPISERDPASFDVRLRVDSDG